VQREPLSGAFPSPKGRVDASEASGRVGKCCA